MPLPPESFLATDPSGPVASRATASFNPEMSKESDALEDALR